MPRSIVFVLLVTACDCGEGREPHFESAESTATESTDVPSIQQRCARAEADAADVLGVHASVDVAEPLRTCIGVSDGAWMFAPIEATSEARSGEDPYGMGEPGEIVHGTATTIRYRVTYLAPDGETYQEAEERSVTLDTFEHIRDSVHVKHVFDYDGDGNHELVLDFRENVFEESDFQRVFWTYRDGEIRDYAPAGDIDVYDLVDRDGDGRMDIVSSQAFYPAMAWSNPDGSIDGNPEVLFHSLPDGTFSPSDEIAAAFLREKCPTRPATFIEGEDLAAAELAVTCARLWGATAASVRAQLRGELESLPERSRDDFRDVLVERADVEPPLTLSGPGGEAPPTVAPATWHCLCYREADGEGGVRDATACRRSPEPCAALERRAANGQGSMESLVEACRAVGEAAHPRELLGEAAWEPSSRPGAFWVPGACVMR